MRIPRMSAPILGLIKAEFDSEILPTNRYLPTNNTSYNSLKKKNIFEPYIIVGDLQM